MQITGVEQINRHVFKTLFFLDTFRQVVRYFGKSEDPDEMLRYVALHQGLHCLQE